MRTPTKSHRPRRAARAARPVTALAAGLGLLAGLLATGVVLAAPAEAAETPVVVVDADSLEGARQVPFHIDDFAPGDDHPVAVVVRNEADSAAQVTYRGAEFSQDALAEHVQLTIRREGVVLGSGRADSARLDGATFQLAPGASTRLRVDLSIPAAVGNEAQGETMRGVFRFEIRGGSAAVETGVASKGALPPTGESLDAFHLLVWGALSAFAALLALLLLAALRRRDEEEQLRPLTIFDDIPEEGR
jgi:hypothetical protein